MHLSGEGVFLAGAGVDIGIGILFDSAVDPGRGTGCFSEFDSWQFIQSGSASAENEKLTFAAISIMNTHS